jgi:hypothetical protein
MLIYTPRWLFLMPGLLLTGAGALLALILYFNGLSLGEWHAGLSGLATACAATIVGLQLIAFSFFTKVFGVGEGLLPPSPKFTRIFEHFTLERGIVGGLVLFLAGLALFFRYEWDLRIAHVPESPFELRKVIAATTLVVLGLHGIFASFFMSVLGLKTVSRRPPEPTNV